MRQKWYVNKSEGHSLKGQIERGRSIYFVARSSDGVGGRRCTSFTTCSNRLLLQFHLLDMKMNLTYQPQKNVGLLKLVNAPAMTDCGSYAELNPAPSAHTAPTLFLSKAYIYHESLLDSIARRGLFCPPGLA